MPNHSPTRHPVHRRPADALRVHTIRLSVSGPELDQIRARASRAGQRLGPHLRACALIGSAESTQIIDALVRLRGEMRGALGNLNQASHRANLLIAAARDGAGGLDLAGLAQEQREILALEVKLRDWMDESRALLARIEGRAEK
jgi:hypothetical protein